MVCHNMVSFFIEECHLLILFFFYFKFKLSGECQDLPNGRSHSRQHAASAPAEAPLILSSKRCGAYFLKHTETPT